MKLPPKKVEGFLVYMTDCQQSEMHLPMVNHTPHSTGIALKKYVIVAIIIALDVIIVMPFVFACMTTTSYMNTCNNNLYDAQRIEVEA